MFDVSDLSDFLTPSANVRKPLVMSRRLILGYLVISFLLLSALSGCGESTGTQTITLWHQMVVGERVVLQELIDEFEASHPGCEIVPLYKETEELRSGFQAAVLAGVGPELVFGPSDSLGAYVTMGLVQDLDPWFDTSELDTIVPEALIRVKASQGNGGMLVQVGDRVGNHLALVYNRNLLDRPPENTEQLVEFARRCTLDADGDGKPEQYGLVWNFIEPFFFIPFLTGYEGWVFEDDGVTPSLDTEACVRAMQFVNNLQQKHRVLPANCDYETADALFKNGQAAMIINGDWSWGDYLKHPGIDAVVVPLPVVSETGRPMGPMVAPKGYSLNVNARGPNAETAVEFLKFMTSESSQRKFMERLKTLPSCKSLLNDPALQRDATLAASALQRKNGRAMPVNPELRAIWDSMRPPYQSLLAGNSSPEESATQMQSLAVASIANMNRTVEPSPAASWLKWIAVVLALGLVLSQRNALLDFLKDWKSNKLAYWMIAPSILVIALTIVYPFFYNLVLSFSNMSLRSFQDWQITGFQNYEQIVQANSALSITFWEVLIKTLVWTFVCVFFHVAIGLLLAVMLNGPVKGKSVYRILLILPWAIPAYITALTWRGMFDTEYGAVNLLAAAISLPTPNWLGDETNALIACIITNIWLGFPFMMVIALGGMQGIPAELYEAARIDRVSRWKQFWHITLPMLKPVLLPAITLGTIWTFNNLNVVWLVSNGGEPSDQTHILVSYVYKAVFSHYQYGYGAALSVVIFLMLLAFSLVFLSRSKATERVA